MTNNVNSFLIPDMEMLRRLYHFGGLLVYQVSWFNPMTFSVVDEKPTFNEDVANAKMESLRADGLIAEVKSFLVKFDGAFSKESQ